MEAQQTSLFEESSEQTGRNAMITRIDAHPRFIQSMEPVPKPAPRRSASDNRTAQPIRSIEQIRLIEDALLASSRIYGQRNRTIFAFGICTGRRCGDILSLRVGDVWDSGQGVKQELELIEEKTGKRTLVGISSELSPILHDYIVTLKDKQPEAPLFPSRKSNVIKQKERMRNDAGCLTTKSFWKIMKDAGEALNVSHLSTHSMRKTFGYTFYMQFVGTSIEGQYAALDALQMLFGHSSALITLRYIGITEDICLRMYRDLKMYDRKP